MWLINSIIRFIQDGGPFMYPILVVGALGTAIVIERFIKLSAVRMANESMWKRLHPVLVITSYSIHYTKLYENASTLKLL